MLIFFHSLFLAFLREAFTLFFDFFGQNFSFYLLFDQNFSFSIMDKHKNWGYWFLTRGILEYLHNYIHFWNPFSCFEFCWKRVSFWSRKFSFVSGKRDFMSSDNHWRLISALMLFLLTIFWNREKININITLLIYILGKKMIPLVFADFELSLYI